MNIFHFCESLALSTGGTASAVSQLCDHLSSSFGRITLVQKKRSTGVGKELNFKSDIGRLDIMEFGALNERGNHLGHSHGIWSPFSHQATLLCYKSGIPLIVSPHGMLTPWAMAYRKWKKMAAWYLYQRRDLRYATAFHATAFSEAEDIRRLGFRQPIAVIPNGVEAIPESPLQPDQVVLPKNKKCVLFLSRIHPKKGLSILLQAWARIKPDDWELVIAGIDASGYQQQIELLANSLGVGGSVRFVGPLYGADKDTAYRRADLFVLPSYSENFGMVVAEALQYRVPVITTTGTPWQELNTKRCGWWIEPNEEALWIAIKEAISLLPHERMCMGERGEELVTKEYCWQKIVEKMLQFYQWVSYGQSEQKPDCVLI